jgi:hypothetical protein
MLTALNEGYEPRVVKLESRGAILGRGPVLNAVDASTNNILRLIKVTTSSGKPPLNISRDHCRIERSDQNEWILKDLGSNNGLFVNGERMKKQSSVVLKNFAVIKLATSRNPSYEYRFSTDSLPTNTSTANVPTASPTKLSVLQELNLEAQKELAELKTLLENQLKCLACKSLINNAACLPCGHSFCRDCLKSSVCVVCQTTMRFPIKGFASKCQAIDSLVAFYRRGKLFADVDRSETMRDINNDNMLTSSPSSASGTIQVWIGLKEPDDEGLDNENSEALGNHKRVKMQSTNTPKETDVTTTDEPERCSYCGEIAHEEGVRCPHKGEKASDDEDEESDLEDYV